MVAKKKIFCILSVAFVFVCCLTMALLFVNEMPTTAYASRSSLGTNTEGEWQGEQTSPNLITIGNGNLAAQGWQNIHSQIKATAVWYKDADLKTEEYGWGIQAQGSSDDIGTKEYTNGVWYRVTLSEADRVKANKGDLSVYASSLNFRQDAAITTCVSLKLFFDDASGAQIGEPVVNQKNIGKSAYKLELNTAVPTGTASIRYYVSNWGSLSARPYIGGLTLTLTDTSAPSVSGVEIDDSRIVDPTNDILIGGDSIKVTVSFDEYVSVTSFGTATLALNNKDLVNTSTGELIQENGKSKVCYSIQIPSAEESGSLTLKSISALSVKDEGGNAYTYNSTSTNLYVGQFYKVMSVSFKTQNLTYSNATTATYGTAYTVALSANNGYNLPTSISVKRNGTILTAGVAYSYDSSTGNISIFANQITGDFEITANGVPKTCTVTFDQQSGIGGTNSVVATYTATMNAITPPTRVGYTFQGYFASKSGQGKKYYDSNGTNVANCDFYTSTTLYAHWTANPYNVKYNANKPTTASASVTGTTANSSHNYDESKALTTNGFSLVGWTFKGWATRADGAVSYGNKESVLNLTSTVNDTVNLYAVWSANEYTVKYNANKPTTASSNVTGTTANSTHTYDTQKALSSNGYSLVGWTFKGWATTADGSVAYADKASVKNLTSTASGTYNLYAVWEANTYTVKYNANKPTTASSNVTGTTANSTHTYDTQKTLSSNGYTLKGWTFKGWATTANGTVAYTNGQKVENLTSANGGIFNLYAVWEANKYTIAFNANKPTNASSNVTGTTADATHNYDESKVLPANGYSLKGWTFKGWATTANGSVRYANKESVANLTANSNGKYTLYAVWQENTYSVHYEANKPATASGSVAGSMTNSTHTYDNDSALSANGFSLIGWTFKGWATTASGSVVYANNAEVLNLTATASGTYNLYAVWQANTYNIVYETNLPTVASNSVLGTTENSIHTYDEGKALSANGYTLKGWTFKGWATTANGSVRYADKESVVNLTSTAKGVYHLYAVWEANVYNLSFDSMGGSFLNIVSATFDAVLPEISLPTKNGYNFQGFFTSPDDAGELYYDEEETLRSTIQRTKTYVYMRIGVRFTIRSSYTARADTYPKSRTLFTAICVYPPPKP